MLNVLKPLIVSQYTPSPQEMNHLYFYYILGVINFRYDTRRQTFTSSKTITMLKVMVHLFVPNAVLLWITIIGQTGIWLTVPSVHITVFFLRITFTVLTMNVNILLNYYFTGKKQMALLNECQAHFRAVKFFNEAGTKPSFRGSQIALVIFLLHYINYELNQYTYVVLYNEKWPEFTFYVMVYFIEMITVMNVLYYDSVIDVMRESVRMDCMQLTKCMEQNLKYGSGSLGDSYWWRTIEHFYNRVLSTHRQRKDYCRAFRLQLATSALTTFIVSFSIFYTNLNSILSYKHEGLLEKYKRVTESLGFFSQLGVVLIICHHATKLNCEQRCLARLIIEAQSKLTKRSSNMKRGDMYNSRIFILQHEMKISPYDLFEIDMEYFFGMVAAIITYLVVLLQFRDIEFG
ncbi:uncharacterized protein LOC125770118 isoform X2 [Anopheles funestus]|uniref:uncharacterized protein LOC125770118 isoform X2 n=1 Tax=Anopheles funestus TaxID=62324 RepID=UPI0020C662B1|nr:uncharacterized protein LOC125770118 isoform X2 [Anopheles funestus]